MAGHSHWKQIKQQKGATDVKRAKVFSKLLAAISVAARNDPNPDFNPRLKSAIEKARMNQVPQENIERAIKKSGDTGPLEEVTIEAYGPGNIALVIRAITDSRNRTVAELKHLLGEHGAKMAEQGSVLWAFEKCNGEWAPKFTHVLPPADAPALRTLLHALDEHGDVERVVTNLAL